MLKETRIFNKWNLFRRILIETNFGNIAMYSFLKVVLFQKITNFSNFEILSKSDLLEKPKSMHNIMKMKI